MKEIDLYIKKLNKIVEIKFDENMSKHCSFKLGGKAKFYVEPKDVKELKKIIKLSKKFKVDYFILGNGSNVIFRDGNFNGIVITLKRLNKILKNKNDLIVEAGVNMFVLNHYLRENNMSGLEFSYGIPGSFGGAVYMNAGAFNGEIKDVINKVTFLHNGHLKSKKRKSLEFGYRFSSFQKTKDIIISASLHLPFKPKQDIIYLQNVCLLKRKESQPLEYPSAGSVFKRQGNIIPAKVIDELGFKGLKFGGVMVSDKHAGFIVNFNNGNSSDLECLIDFIKEVVKQKRNIDLESEIIFVGDKK